MIRSAPTLCLFEDVSGKINRADMNKIQSWRTMVNWTTYHDVWCWSTKCRGTTIAVDLWTTPGTRRISIYRHDDTSSWGVQRELSSLLSSFRNRNALKPQESRLEFYYRRSIVRSVQGTAGVSSFSVWTQRIRGIQVCQAVISPGYPAWLLLLVYKKKRRPFSETESSSFSKPVRVRDILGLFFWGAFATVIILAWRYVSSLAEDRHF
jgi:hypothetical protein